MEGGLVSGGVGVVEPVAWAVEGCLGVDVLSISQLYSLLRKVVSV